MKNTTDNYLHITALWAFSEAFLGGILHAIKIPFAGLILSAFAVICMSAIALPENKKGRILKATILVMIIKAMLSPHTPIAAYLAVGLQGICGEIIFMSGLTHRISAFILAIFALMQSAFQKIIILTLLFGTEFWTAIDKFLNGINKDMGIEDRPYSIYLVAIYLSLYFIAGIITGIFAGKLSMLKIDDATIALLNNQPLDFIAAEKKRKKWFANPLYWILLLLLTIILVSAYREQNIFAVMESKAWKLFFRAILLMLLWYFFIAPLLLQLFHKWLSKQKNKLAADVEQIIILLPEMKLLVMQSWNASVQKNVFKRINKFLSIIFYLLQKRTDEN